MFDCFTFNDRLYLLELRLNLLNDVVEKFVIVECDRTYTGQPKELVFAKNKHLFTRFLDKIIYIQYEFQPQDGAGLGVQAWHNEGKQRNAILDALKISQPSDGLFFISDEDEIPRPEKLLEAKALALQSQLPIAISVSNCMYYLNFASDAPYWGPYLYFPSKAKQFHDSFTNDSGLHPDSDPTTFRWHVSNVENDFVQVHNGGWHFSMTGGLNVMRKKLVDSTHVEFNIPEIRSDEHLLNCIREGVPYYEKLFKFKNEELRFSKRDPSFLPAYVQENINRFEEYIL